MMRDRFFPSEEPAAAGAASGVFSTLEAFAFFTVEVEALAFVTAAAFRFGAIGDAGATRA